MSKRKPKRNFWYGIQFMENCFYAFDMPGTTYKEMRRDLVRLQKEQPLMYLNPSSKIVRVRKI